MGGCKLFIHMLGRWKTCFKASTMYIDIVAAHTTETTAKMVGAARVSVNSYRRQLKASSRTKGYARYDDTRPLRF